MTYADGRKNTGRFMDGNRNREGTYTYATGTVITVRYIP